MKTIKLENGKYSIEFDDRTGQVVDFLRYGESWPAGNDLRYSGVVTALVHRVIELENQVEELEFQVTNPGYAA